MMFLAISFSQCYASNEWLFNENPENTYDYGSKNNQENQFKSF